MIERNGGSMDDLISRQEAIEAVKDALNPNIVSFVKAKMALEALPSAQPKKRTEERTETHGVCLDAIDRQAAIDAILAVTGNSSVRELYEHVQEHGLSEMWSGGVNAAIDIIIAVPSAQPEPCGDVVSRNAIVQKLNEMDRYVSTELRLCDTDKKFPQNEVFIVDDVYEEIVEQLPSAQPQRTGRWIYGEDNPGTGRDGWFCSKCGHFEMWDYSADMKSAELNLPNFCPNCGARMEGK